MTIIPCILAAVALLCGCSQKPDPRIAETGKRLDDLSARLENLASKTTLVQSNLAAAILATDERAASQLVKINPETGLPATEAEVNAVERLEKLELQYSNLVMTVNGKIPARRVPPAQNYSGGMPDAVAAQIRNAAEAKWPNQYDMQVYEIKVQAEAWQKLHP